MTEILVDLPDARRAAKPWLPTNDGRDVSDGLVTLVKYDGLERLYPACYKHGAMNRVMAERRVYRCSEMRCGIGAEVVDD